jgi:hypothetical protein
MVFPLEGTSASSLGKIGSPQQVKYCRRVALLASCQKILRNLQTMCCGPVSTELEFRVDVADDNLDSHDGGERAAEV